MVTNVGIDLSSYIEILLKLKKERSNMNDTSVVEVKNIQIKAELL